MITKILMIILIFNNTLILPADAINTVSVNNNRASIMHDFKTDKINSNEVSFKIQKNVVKNKETIIPKNSIVTADIEQFQKEKRWHKSGFILCKMKNYKTDNKSKEISLEDKDIYVELRKYEKINPWKAILTGIEISGGTVASCFLPGVDMAYFFLKGMIFKDKAKNVLMSAISSVYDNSIFWFPQKGRPIELAEGDQIELKSIKKEKAIIKKERITLQKEKDFKRKLIVYSKIAPKFERIATKRAIKNEKMIVLKFEKKLQKSRKNELKAANQALAYEKKYTKTLAGDIKKLKKYELENAKLALANEKKPNIKNEIKLSNTNYKNKRMTLLLQRKIKISNKKHLYATKKAVENELLKRSGGQNLKTMSAAAKI